MRGRFTFKRAYTCALCSEHGALDAPSRLAKQQAKIGSLQNRKLPPVLLTPATSINSCAGVPCTQVRGLYDGVATAQECARLRGAATRAFAYLDVQPGSQGDRLLTSPSETGTEELLGSGAAALVAALMERMKALVVKHHNDAGAQQAGWLFSSICPPRGAESPDPWPLAGIYAPHVDRANVASYDMSALLYLTDADVDHDGGRFAFHDPDRDRLVKPIAGRMLTFCAGWHQLHSVRPVTRGERMVLSVWYQSTLPKSTATCSAV